MHVQDFLDAGVKQIIKIKVYLTNFGIWITVFHMLLNKVFFSNMNGDVPC